MNILLNPEPDCGYAESIEAVNGLFDRVSIDPKMNVLYR